MDGRGALALEMSLAALPISVLGIPNAAFEVTCPPQTILTFVRGSAKRQAPGCVIAAGKARQKW